MKLTHTYSSNVQQEFNVVVVSPSTAEINDGNVRITVDRHSGVQQIAVLDGRGHSVPILGGDFYNGDKYNKTRCNFIPYSRAVIEAFARYDREAKILDEIDDTQRRLDELKVKAKEAGISVD